MNYIYAYYQGIKNGSLTVGTWIEKLYDYIIRAIDEKQILFDQKKANDAIDWIETHCFHTEGPLAPGPFKLELWQKSLVSCIFGLIDPKTGKRQFREVVAIMARKNGKSILMSAIAKYTLQIDGGYGARIFCLAPKLEQADIIYSNTWQMCQLDPEQQQLKEIYEGNRDAHNKRTGNADCIIKKRQSDIFLPQNNSSIKKIAFSAKRSDGFNPSLTICDEIASWEGEKGLRQYEVMKSGMGARPEGLLLSCSTSGYVNDSIYDELIKRSTRFLLGDSKEKRLLPFLYMIDDIDKWNDINELRKSNPNLGVSVSVDYLLEEIAVAEGSLSKAAEFKVKYCNVKQNASSAWLNAQDMNQMFSDEQLCLSDFGGCYCVVGIDLSQTTDLTAAVAVIERNGRLYTFAQFWKPEEKFDEATAVDNMPYRIYQQRGLITASGENYVDYHDCFQWIVDLVEKYKIYPLVIGYDRYSAQYLIQDLNAYGFKTDDVYQGFNLTPVIAETEGLVKDGAFAFGDNDLMKAHLLNAALKIDTEQNKKRLVKTGVYNRIDGVAALLDAMCVRQKWYAELGEMLHNRGN